MTVRLDLKTRNRPDCFGCADCGQWFMFARELIAHLREHARPADE